MNRASQNIPLLYSQSALCGRKFLVSARVQDAPFRLPGTMLASAVAS